MGHTIDDVKNTLILCAAAVVRQKSTLEEIDSLTGDGDMGISMQKGCTAIIAEAESYTEYDIGKFFGKCAMAFNRAAPSTMGTLLSCGFMQCAKKFGGLTELDGSMVLSIPWQFADAIMLRGKAHEGDRTVLDALLPLCRSLDKSIACGLSTLDALAAAYAAAVDGMERTKKLEPKMGRAKWAPDNADGIPDGGAVLCVIVIKAFLEQVEGDSL